MKKLRIFVMPLMAISLLASCGGGDTPGPGPEPGPDPIETPLNFKCLSKSASLNAVSGEKFNKNEKLSLEYSYDNKTWEEVVFAPLHNVAVCTFSLEKNDVIYFRGNAGLDIYGFSFKAGKINDDFEAIKDGELSVCGNIMSLLQKTDFVTLKYLRESEFRQIFEESPNIVDASNLVLPATTLAKNCYYEMFAYCTNLKSAPSLPATTLAQGCYGSMFQGCTNLASAPNLPVTTLAEDCYWFMFSECEALTSAPNLPATTLVDGCYSNMFNGCSNLKHLEVKFGSGTEWPFIDDDAGTYNWLRGVPDVGTFIWNGSTDTSELTKAGLFDPRGDKETEEIHHIPANWAVQNPAN